MLKIIGINPSILKLLKPLIVAVAHALTCIFFRASRRIVNPATHTIFDNDVLGFCYDDYSRIRR